MQKINKTTVRKNKEFPITEQIKIPNNSFKCGMTQNNI